MASIRPRRTLTASAGRARTGARRVAAGVAVALVTAAGLAALAPSLNSPPAPVRCNRVASPAGSDAAAGTVEAPLRSVSALVAALRPGEVGCIHGGVYYEDVKVTRGGRAAAPITIRSFPGERATLAGRLWIARGADHVVVAVLALDGRPTHGANHERLPSPTVDAADTTFAHDDVTNDHTGICFVLGSPGFGRALRTVIRDSRVHDCGRLPPTNHDHGIYVEYADGATIERNWIYANADRGVQLYPDAQRTTIARNVIDGNGEGIIFSGDAGVSASDTRVERNLITNSTERSDVESFYPRGTPPGRRNVVRRNCIFGARSAAVDLTGGGFALVDNTFADPLYVNGAAHDYRLRDGSPCAALAVSPPA